MTYPPVFLNTRPIISDRTFCQFLPKDIAVVDLPLLDIIPVQDDGYNKKLNNLLNEHYQLILFVSPIAVQFFKNALTTQQITKFTTQSHTHLTVLAVGSTTKQALTTLGINAISPDDPKNENNEGLMCLPTVQTLVQNGNLSVLIIKGMGGRTVFKNFLTQQGAMVDEWVLYKRVMPDHLQEQAKALLTTHHTFIVLITSEQAFGHWQKLLVGQAHRPTCYYICLGKRLTTLVQTTASKVFCIDRLEEVAKMVQNIISRLV